MELKQLVNNNIDSYNGYEGETARKNMSPNVIKHILDIDEMITKVYKRADAKKYPLRNNSNDASKTAGSNKRMEGFKFVESLSEGIRKTIPGSEQRLLTELQDAMNREDIDYASSLIDAVDNLALKTNNKFYNDYTKLKKEYFVKIGVEDINQELKELKTRQAEFSFILEAINSNDQLIMLPRKYDEIFSGVDLIKNPQAKDVSFKLLPFVNKSTSFLSSRGASLRWQN